MNNQKLMPLFFIVFVSLFTSSLFINCARASVSATAQPIRVDVRAVPFPRIISPADLAYSPYWQSTSNGCNRSVRIDLVTDPDTESAVTNTIFTGSTGIESYYTWTSDSAAQPYCRLLHWTLDGGTPTGMPLACDVVIARCSPAGTAFVADTCTNRLQEIADIDDIADLAYSPIWTFGGNSIRIKRIIECENPVSVRTNLIFQSGSLVESEYSLALSSVPSGHCILQHITLDDTSKEIGEILTAEFVIDRPNGTIIILR